MGASSSAVTSLSDNEYLRRLAGMEFITENDPFWNQLLSFSFQPPLTCMEYEELEEHTGTICKALSVNNLNTGNFGALIRVFLIRAAELKAAAQCENNIFTWQTYNALLIIRCICKYFVKSLNEDKILNQFKSQPPQKNSVEDGRSEINLEDDLVELLMNALTEVIVDVPVLDYTYMLHLEAINTLLILLSIQVQAYAKKPRKSLIFKYTTGKCSIHACLLMKALLQHYIKQEKCPLNLQQNSNSGNLILGLASGLWNVLTFGYAGASKKNDDYPNALLANQSLLLMLVLANHCTQDKGVHNPYRQALFSFSNSQDSTSTSPLQAVATFKLDYSKLYNAICQTLKDGQTTLFLYLLVHRNTHFKNFILSRTDVDNLVVPILRILYNAQEKNCQHIYMALIILLILSEDNFFNKSIHETMLKNIFWYNERNLSEITLGGLFVLVVIRTVQFNMTRMRDKYLHTNCLAALANMSSQFKDLHPYVTQRIVSLFEHLAKRYTRIQDQIHDGQEETAPSDQLRDLIVLEEVIHMVLEIINSCLTNMLLYNPNLIYTLLYKRHSFEPFRSHPTFQDIIQNIDTILTYFSVRLENADKNLSVQEVLEIITQGALQWPRDRLKKFPELKFKYVEEEKPEDFFIPYIWYLVYSSSNTFSNLADIFPKEV